MLIALGTSLVVSASIGAVTLLGGAAAAAVMRRAAGGLSDAIATPNASSAMPDGSPGPSSSAAATSQPSATTKGTTQTNPPTGGCAFTVSEGVCPVGPPMAAAAGKRWRVSYAAEFSGSSYDGT